MVHHRKWFWKNLSGCLPSPIKSAGSQPTSFPGRGTQLQSPWLWSSRSQMTPGLHFFLYWKFQNAGNFCLVAILNQSESKSQEYMKHMELPQNCGKCWIEIMPSPRLVSACVTLGHNYHSLCVCSYQIVWNSACPVSPLWVVCFQQQMGGGWGGCGMRNAGNVWGLQAFWGCFGVHCKEKDDCWCHIIHLAAEEAAFGVNHLLENAQELSLSSASKASCQLNDVEEEGLLLQLWSSSTAIPSLPTVLSPRWCVSPQPWARAVPQLSWQ